MEQYPDDRLEMKTPFGPIAVRGSLVIIVLLLLAGGYLTWMINKDRQAEHMQIMGEQKNIGQQIVNALNQQACLTKLNLFIITAKDPTKINIATMPTELWNCLPRFLTEEQQEQRKKAEAR